MKQLFNYFPDKCIYKYIIFIFFNVRINKKKLDFFFLKFRIIGDNRTTFQKGILLNFLIFKVFNKIDYEFGWIL